MSRLLVCGIGNQGSLYKNHRHSIGLFIVEALRSHLRYPAWSKDNKCSGYWSNVAGPCILFKANFWMNQSGRPVSKAYQKVGGQDWGQLCVVYDDLELPVGVAKLRTDGMGKGHNGIRSCVGTLRTENFLRIAVGIGRPESRDPEIVSQYVLSDVPPEELDIIQYKTLHNIIALLEPLVNLKASPS